MSVLRHAGIARIVEQHGAGVAAADDSDGSGSGAAHGVSGAGEQHDRLHGQQQVMNVTAPPFVRLEGSEFINRERLVIVADVDLDAAARLAHVREFLERVDRHFPEGVPLRITYAIRDELQLLEAAVINETKR